MDEEKGEFRVVLRCSGIFENCGSTLTNDVTRRNVAAASELNTGIVYTAVFSSDAAQASRNGTNRLSLLCSRFHVLYNYIAKTI